MPTATVMIRYGFYRVTVCGLLLPKRFTEEEDALDFIRDFMCGPAM